MNGFNSIIIRYGEIGLKGKNRIDFEKKLKNDIKNVLAKNSLTRGEVILRRGRIYVHNVEECSALNKIMGIYSYSPAQRIKKDYLYLRGKIEEYLPLIKKADSFRVSCQRVDKTFGVTSVTVERELGEILFENTRTPVNLKNPDINLQVEIGMDFIYIFFKKVKAQRGLPYGSAGKLVSLISSGIDSPVATYLMMKRGVEPILLHVKITEDDCRKVKQIKEILQEYTSGRELELYIVEREEIFLNQFDKIFTSQEYNPYACLIRKYLMHKKAQELAEAKGAYGIITGDNLAQVASQTLKNLFAYKFGAKYPVYSPLISFEKEDTIKIAKSMGTYEISIRKALACTPPKNPKTGVSLEIFRSILDKTGLT